MTASINEFQNLLSDYIPELIKKGQKIGGLVENQTKLVAMAFDRQLEFVRTASISAKPSSDAEFMAMLKPMSDLITQAQVGFIYLIIEFYKFFEHINFAI